MGSLLNPYISFKDNARDAMEFYQSVFGGEPPSTPSASTARSTPRAPIWSCTAS